MTDALATVPHVGLTVTDPEVSRQWYQRLFNAAPVLAGAAMRPLPGAGRLPGPGHPIQEAHQHRPAGHLALDPVPPD
jgi:hypothetical protein